MNKYKLYLIVFYLDNKQTERDVEMFVSTHTDIEKVKDEWLKKDNDFHDRDGDSALTDNDIYDVYPVTNEADKDGDTYDITLIKKIK